VVVTKKFAALLLATVLLGVAPAEAVDTLWNFNGNLAADFGAGTLAYRGNTASQTTFATTAGLGIAPLPFGNGTETVMGFPAATSTQGYTVTHNGAAVVNEYTMVWDVYYPESSDKKWRPLLQTSTTNANDGDFFVRDVPWGGVGISGQYHGVIKPDEWNRVALTRDNSGVWRKYINGGYVGQQDASTSRFALDPTFLLFADENNDTAPGYVSSFRYLDRTMTPSEVSLLGGVNAAGAATAGSVFNDPSVVTPGSFTIAILGDTQNYSQSNPAIYAQQTQWLADNKAARNLQMVLHVGDIVNVDTTSQWNAAVAAQSKLDGVIPYAMAPGNHDYSNSRSVSQFNLASRFGPGSPYAAQPTLEGFFPDEPNSRMNTYHVVEANGQKLLVLALEFGPRDQVVDWAKTVAEAHPDHRLILLTHGAMYDGGRWFDARVDPNDPQGRTYDQVRDSQVHHPENESIYNPKSYSWAADSNDGWDLWDKLVRGQENSSLVIAGHQYDDRDGFPYQLEENDAGNDVYHMLVNMQARNLGGEGWIRLLEFDPDGVTVRVKSYSPYYDKWSYATDENFTITLSPVTLAGDFNGDGAVNAADYTVWRDGEGSTGVDLAADGDNDGDVDAQDYTIWRDNYGRSIGSGPSQAVPEPAGLACLMGGVMACLVWFESSVGRPRHPSAEKLSRRR